MNKNKNYYHILSIDKTCTKDEIKSAYRTLSKKYHPDVCTNDEEKYMFEEVNEAYDVLFSDSVRSEWDSLSRFGSKYDSTNDLKEFEFSNDSDQYSFYKEEFLKSSGDSINILLQLKSFKEVVEYKRLISCNYCEGSGLDKSKLTECFICKGEGLSNNGKECFLCSGTGYMPQEDCDTCYGTGKSHGVDCPMCKSSGKLNLGKCLECIDGRQEVTDILHLKEDDFKDKKCIVEGRGNSSKISPGVVGNVYLRIMD